MEQALPDNVWICQTAEEVSKIVADNRLVIVKLGATWCGPCKIVAPAYSKLASNFSGYKNIAFLSVDIDENTMYNEKVAAVPAFIFYVNGEQQDDLMQLGADISAVESVISSVISSVNGVQSDSAQKSRVQPPGRTKLEEEQVSQRVGYGAASGGYATHTDESAAHGARGLRNPGPKMSQYTR